MPSITSQYLARYRRLGAGEGADDPLPVTGAQRRFVLVRSLDPVGRPDLVPMFFAFPRGTVDPARLTAAADRLAALHPVLRARPTVVRGTPVLLPQQPAVPLARVHPAPGEDTTSTLRRALADWTPQGPPIRMFLAQDEADDGEEVLAIVLDHAACDGQSLARLVDELEAAYTEGPAATGPGPGEAVAELASYREAVLLQLEAEDRASSPAAMAYWGERLRATREQAPQPRANRPIAAELPSGSAELMLPSAAPGVPFPDLLDACRAAARTLYGAGHVVPIGYPWGGRPPGAAPVLGCFLNTVVFPAATAQTSDAHPTSSAWWDDLDRADTPFDAVVHAARAAGSGWTGRLDGLLTVDDATRRPLLRLGGVTAREIHIDGRSVRGPFAVSVTQGTELHLRMVWDRAVLDDDTAERAFTALTDAVREPAGTPG
ncbi:non-ribosomal peptide synthetase [Streptomyces olivochromogenes]|uniref:non-ribosomal peptide synthetase n=1 Tax=Streptomyces olivochromogenes TaxID=1963 RepID=UPI001F157D64|nr:non-ribosomal peptide synthetase [Streptomyces olivochromogenes]MCF3131542.1 non-ribosomal peptide synthetase [Streptomyces olivochromogenes]